MDKYQMILQERLLNQEIIEFKIYKNIKCSMDKKQQYSGVTVKQISIGTKKEWFS